MFGLPERQANGMWDATAISGWIRGLGLPIGSGSREWSGHFEGHEVRVVTRGLLRARLYVDRECLDRRSPLLARRGKVPLLSARISSAHQGVTMVEVFSRAMWARRIQVMVRGKSVKMDLHLPV
jgi:hypothetical protein